MFAGVSRAAVHKRLKDGKLTAFLFHVTRASRSIFGYQKKLKQLPYAYVPVSECKAWGVELKSRPDRRETVPEAAGGPEGDRQDEVLDRDPKDKGSKAVKYGEPVTREEVLSLVKLLVAEAVAKALPEGMRKARRRKRERKALGLNRGCEERAEGQ